MTPDEFKELLREIAREAANEATCYEWGDGIGGYETDKLIEMALAAYGILYTRCENSEGVA
jgi:hypothetical protein